MGRIGNVEIKGKAILAPMAGICNEAFFYIAKKYGASLLVSEMVSDKGLIYQNKKTNKLLTFDSSLHPFSIQLFGNNKDELLEAAKIVEETCHPDFIDINMGCSVPKIFKAGNGSALLKDPNNIYEIVKTLVDNLNTPITVKIRSGIDHKSLNYLEVGRLVEKAGASMIAIHPRTKSDLFRGNADYDIAKELKEVLSIPVCISGDIKTPEDCKRVLEYTKCDYAMIGRAAMGNPFIFKEINEYLETGTYSKVSDIEKFDTMIEHFNHLMDLKGEKVAVMEMRSHAAWYVRGMRDNAKFKVRLNSVTTKDELMNLISEYRDDVVKDEL